MQRKHLSFMILISSILIATAALAIVAYAEGGETESSPEVAPSTNLEKSLVALSAAIAVASSTIASAMALRIVASAGFAASAERPELSSYLLILGGLAEGIAIYGLLVAILLLGKI
ncbi:MAG: ATPase [Thermoprotei archaeon]|nr:MAG: ATPase [Thermoprotei archaeon]